MHYTPRSTRIWQMDSELTPAPTPLPLSSLHQHPRIRTQGQVHKVGIVFTTNKGYEHALPADALSCTPTVQSDFEVQTFSSPAEARAKHIVRATGEQFVMMFPCPNFPIGDGVRLKGEVRFRNP